MEEWHCTEADLGKKGFDLEGRKGGMCFYYKIKRSKYKKKIVHILMHYFRLYIKYIIYFLYGNKSPIKKISLNSLNLSFETDSIN